MMMIKYVRTPARRALPLALSHMRMPLARPRTHARPPLHLPPHAPSRAARPHRTKVLDCALPVSACTALFLSLYTGTHRTPPHAERVEKCIRAGPPRGDNQYALGRTPPLPPPSPFPFCPLLSCHTHRHTGATAIHRRTGVTGRHVFFMSA